MTNLFALMRGGEIAEVVRATPQGFRELVDLGVFDPEQMIDVSEVRVEGRPVGVGWRLVEDEWHAPAPTTPAAPPDPVEPTPPAPAGPTAEEFAQMRADLDWVINFAVTGEA